MSAVDQKKNKIERDSRNICKVQPKTATHPSQRHRFWKQGSQDPSGSVGTLGLGGCRQSPHSAGLKGERPRLCRGRSELCIWGSSSSSWLSPVANPGAEWGSMIVESAEVGQYPYPFRIGWTTLSGSLSFAEKGRIVVSLSWNTAERSDSSWSFLAFWKPSSSLTIQSSKKKGTW